MTGSSRQITASASPGPIVFFDGQCPLCHRFVRWLLKRDRGAVLRFAPLQGSTAKEHGVEPADAPENWSVVLVDQRGQWERSAAALRSMAHVGGIWRGAAIFLLVPRFVRDAAYNFIARRRYKWFGRFDTCQMPTDEAREKMLP